MTYTILFVALLIALVWMILYCFYLKNLIKDCNAFIRQVQNERQDLENRFYKFTRELGYQFDWKWEKKEGMKQ